MTTLMIPVLPCVSLPDTLAFYKALGFEVTHEQTRPNVYAATRRGDLHLHFAGVEKRRDQLGAGTCLAIVPEVESLHRDLSDCLRQAYGKLPLAGRPRISRMKKGQSRFTLVDVTGNSVIFIQASAGDDYDEADTAAPRTSIERALQTAARLRDFRNDDAHAARVLVSRSPRTRTQPGSSAPGLSPPAPKLRSPLATAPARSSCVQSSTR